MNPKNVSPARWTEKKILADDGDFSYCYGFYCQDDGSSGLALGGRWNGDLSSIGYPNLGGNPTWFVIDPTMVGPILSELEKRAIVKGDSVAVTTILDARKAFKV